MIYKAVQNGLAHDLSTWAVYDDDTSTWMPASQLPTIEDDVYANGFVVQISQNYYSKMSTNEEFVTLSIVASGVFRVIGNNNITIFGDFVGTTKIAATTEDRLPALHRVEHIGNIGIVGDLSGGTRYRYGFYNESNYGEITIIGDQIGGSDTNSYGFYNTEASTITITGNQTGGSSINTMGFYNTGASTITITGNQTGGKNASAYGFYNTGASTITITGNQTGGSSINTMGFYNTGASTITITGNQTGGSSTNSMGFYNTGVIGICNIVGIAKANLTSNAIYNSSGSSIINFTGSFENFNEIQAIRSDKVYFTLTEDSYFKLYDINGNAQYLVAPNNVQGMPPTSKVEKNYQYGYEDSLTGEMEVNQYIAIPAELQSRLENVAEKDDINNAKIEIITEMSNIDIDLTNIATKEDINNIDFSQASGNKGSKRIID